MKVTKCDCCGKLAEKELRFSYRVEQGDSTGSADTLTVVDICEGCFVKVLNILDPKPRKKRGPKPGKKRAPKEAKKVKVKAEAAPKKKKETPPPKKRGRKPKAKVNTDVLPGQISLPSFDSSKMPVIPPRPHE